MNTSFDHNSSMRDEGIQNINEMRIPPQDGSNTSNPIMPIPVDRENIPELAAHHIVLGRYNGKKMKPLTESIMKYKEFRINNITRSRLYRDEDIEELRLKITHYIQKELKLPNLPLVQFVVDIQNIQKMKKEEQNQLWQSNPEMIQHKEEGTVFVEDKTYYFFKKDLSEKIRPPRKKGLKNPPSTASSSTSIPPPPADALLPTPNACTPTPTPTPTPPTPASTTSHPSIPENVVIGDTNHTHQPCLLSNETDLADGIPVVAGDELQDLPSLPELGGDINDYMNIDLEYPVEMPDLGFGDNDSMDQNTASQQPQLLKTHFEFRQGNVTLEEQAERFCASWQGNLDPSNWDALLRKPLMVTSFWACFEYFKHKLLPPDSDSSNPNNNRPFANSPMYQLRCMQEMLLVDCVTTMLNGMVDAYEQYPKTCLDGEADAWTGKGRQTSNRHSNNNPSETHNNNSQINPSLQTHDDEYPVYRSIPSFNPPPVASAPCVVSCRGRPATIGAHQGPINHPAVPELQSTSSVVSAVSASSDDAVSRLTESNDSKKDAGGEKENFIMKIVRERAQAAAEEIAHEGETRSATVQQPSHSTRSFDIENQVSARSMVDQCGDFGRNHCEKERRLSDVQRILQAAHQASARSFISTSHRSLPVPATQDILLASQLPTMYLQRPSVASLPANVTDVSGRSARTSFQYSDTQGMNEQNENAEAASNVDIMAATRVEEPEEIVRAVDERELDWIERCQMRSEPLVYHGNIFSCNGQLYRKMKSLKDNFTWALGFPIGYASFFLLVEVPVFLFYLMFAGVVGVTCCLLFLISFWEVNFYLPQTPLQLRDWGWKVPIFLVGSLGYILATPLVFFSLMIGWVKDYVCNDRSHP